MIRDISITAVLNGYIVRVGCQTVVYNSPSALMQDLMSYFNSPEQFEQQYLATAINAKHTMGSAVLADATNLYRGEAPRECNAQAAQTTTAASNRNW